jgi:hypothetical protein
MEKAKQPPPTVKEDNALQINIMEKAGIPTQEIPDYALSSVADGKVLRDYVNEVKNGETSVEDVIKKVRHDFEKMKDGEKDGKFVTPASSEQDEIPK